MKPLPLPSLAIFGCLLAACASNPKPDPEAGTGAPGTTKSDQRICFREEPTLGSRVGKLVCTTEASDQRENGTGSR